MSKQINFNDPPGVEVINSDGERQWVQTPFMVSCNQTSNGLPTYKQIYIEEVGTNEHGEVFFIFNGIPYPYSDFTIE